LSNQSRPLQSNVAYPNPAADYVFINHHTSGTWQLYNVSGQAIFNRIEHQDQLIRVDVSDLKPGFYYLRNQNYPEEIIKLIKN